MKIITKTAMAAALAVAGTGIAAAPAAAQANGIATVDLPLAVVQSQALQNGYNQIATQYQAQRTTIEQRSAQRQQLAQSFDTNGDGQIDQAEAASAQDPNNATVRQIQAIDQELAQLQQPINLARAYVVQQVAQQYSAALQQVISDRNIQFVLNPEVVIYGAPAADVTDQVVAQLNSRVPAAQIVPPAGWQPSEAAVGLFQQVQQILLIAQYQQGQAAQQPQQPAQSGR